MVSSEDERESRQIVRMYSWDVEERLSSADDAYALGQVIREDRMDRESINAPWRRFLESYQPSSENE